MTKKSVLILFIFAFVQSFFSIQHVFASAAFKTPAGPSIHAYIHHTKQSPFKLGDIVSIEKGYIQREVAFHGTVEQNTEQVLKDKKLIFSTGTLEFAKGMQDVQCKHVSCHCTPPETIAQKIEKTATLPAHLIAYDENRLKNLDFDLVTYLVARNGTKLASTTIFPASWKQPGTTINHVIAGFPSYAYTTYQQNGHTVSCLVPFAYLKSLKYIPKGSTTGLDEMD